MCFGAWTTCTGLTAIIWPGTSQSNRMRTAARCYLIIDWPWVSIQAAMQRFDTADAADAVLVAPGKTTDGPAARHPGVLVAAGGGEDLQEPTRGSLAGISDDAQHYNAVARGRSETPFRLKKMASDMIC